ncbi:MAG: hypothetical protein QGG88_03540 [Gammaproteobacteria bacterium]|jgi:hypothetical protein|nr:hypothetical protein [Gammaproteobacteria bacterium]
MMDTAQENTAPVTTDEIDLRDIIKPLWCNRWYILLWGILCALVITIYQLGGITLNKNDQAQMQIYFDFQGASDGIYPNGTQFSPLELLSDPVLSAVYKRHIDSDISYDNFSRALTLTPNFSGAEQLEAIVTQLAAQDKGLSVSEFNDSVATYTASLHKHSQTHITLSLDLAIVQGNMAQATRILTAIADTWATQALTDRGVMKLYKPHISSQIITSTDSELIKINILTDTQQRLAETVTEYFADPQLASLTDPESGLTLADLSLLLSTEDKYKISILREMVIRSGGVSGSTAWYKGFREARLVRLERDRDRLQRMVTVYDDAMAQFSQHQQTQTRGVGAANQSPTSQAIYSPQYSEDLVNSLLQLGSKMADPEYRKTLLDEKLNYAAQLQQTITEIEFYHSTANNDNEARLDIETINQLIEASTVRLTDINNALTGIAKLANERFLSDNGQLYSLQGAIQHVATGSLSGSLQIKVLLAFLLGCFFGVILVFFKLLITSNVASSEPVR